ncbi:MFS transporter [Pseudoruegeria sp. SHC-113]|uniref:MFS transporter n=1 Tax=Pseudoruegeria sp. SHC-113 TaxID=2855439 RepID=UPI0021BB7ABB|nr:MFS transporter [Pseudoruegeria sp. SHC-113]MCT8158590.1 MFS transporter [Pseudoruegeria sp. SHC-113]
MSDSALGFARANARWIGAGALMALCSGFGQTYFISIFAGNIRADFGLSHGGWGALYASGTLASAAVMLWAGGLADRFRLRGLGSAVLLGLAVACCAMALASQVWMLPFVVFLLRLFGQGMASHVAMIAMARWFAANRGKAIAFAAFGFSVGEALLPIVFVALMGIAAWQSLWFLCAGLLVAATVLLRHLLRSERQPQSYAESDSSHGLEGRHWTRREALQSRAFWLLAPALFAPSCFVTAFFFQQVHVAEAKGVAHLALVALFPLYTGLSVAAMFATGWAVDRFGTARLLPFYQMPMALGFCALAGFGGLTGIALAMGLMALTTGANAPLPAAVMADLFGTRHLGAIKAVATAIMVLGSAVGPILSGVLIDAGLAFPAQGWGIAVVFVGVSLALVPLARRLRAPLAVAL